VTFEELFDDVYPALHRYCIRMTSDSDVAEDAAQEAFVRLLEKNVQGDPPGLRAWLFKVATHVLRDRARVRDNRSRLLEENPVSPEPHDTPDEVVEREERVARVRRALDSLTERDRTILLLREEGFSYREVAEAVGVKASSVGTLLARARERLGRALASEERT
jgi:RNA polymerase sigma factor (sigma-70 family)